MPNLLIFRCLLLAGLPVFCGCPNPSNTRFPTLAPSPPALERRSYERHDPFPNENLGPETFTRPREFEEQRTEPRRARESQPVPGLFPTAPIGPLPPSAGRVYPEAVPQ